MFRMSVRVVLYWWTRWSNGSWRLTKVSLNLARSHLNSSRVIDFMFLKDTLVLVLLHFSTISTTLMKAWSNKVKPFLTCAIQLKVSLVITRSMVCWDWWVVKSTWFSHPSPLRKSANMIVSRSSSLSILMLKLPIKSYWSLRFTILFSINEAVSSHDSITLVLGSL